MSSWYRLDPTLYAGPVVLARIHDLDVELRRRRAPADVPVNSFVECWALLDTGASHSIVDTERVAANLALRQLDRRRMALAEHGLTDLPVHEVGVSFPDFGFPERVARVSSMRLPGPFWMLVGMDLLEGTRLELDIRGEERWLRWSPVA